MFFGADVMHVNLTDKEGSIDLINEYISKKTGNKVTKMLTSMDPITQLMLINTIFFQGKCLICILEKYVIFFFVP